MKYFLPCSCGKKLTVGLGQSGLTLACECGAKLDVPDRAALTRLEPATAPTPQKDRRPQKQWSGAVVGAVLLVLGLGIAAYLHFKPIDDPLQTAMEELKLADLMTVWVQLQHIGSMAPSSEDGVNKLVAEREAGRLLWRNVCLAVAAVGAGFIGFSFKRSG